MEVNFFQSKIRTILLSGFIAEPKLGFDPPAGNNDGVFNDLSENVSLHLHKGWWQGIATGDFNNDGRGLAVSQNDAETKLYRNNAGRRGYSITLRGPSQNRNGVGSAMRLMFGDGSAGPLREVQTGF